MNPFVFKLQSLLLIVGLLSYTSPVYAYLDPGTGSLLVQGLIGGVAATISFLSIYWHKIKAFFQKKRLHKEVIDKD
tara:strand:- start:114 stop:341 length:228 start_codon:yes stop_codon:yes gene_type:complete